MPYLNPSDYQNMDLMPSTSRALPSRICKKKILYDDKGSSDDESEQDIAKGELNFDVGESSFLNKDENQPGSDDYYEEDLEEDPDPYGVWRQDSTSSDSD